VLDYISYWDAGERIVDVTNPTLPSEVGSLDYNPVVLRSGFEGGLCCAHYAAVTPSANWIYQEDEHGIDQTGGVHILDAHTCDGLTFCHPTEVGFWHTQGHPIQAAAISGQGTGANSPNGQGIGATHGVITRFFTWDAHNLDVQGENTLLLANYQEGIRLINTTDKTNPVEVSFFLPNSNRDIACKEKCFFQPRETWGAMFGADGLIYSSDFWLGFFIVKPTT